LFFSLPAFCTLDNCTLLLIKPAAVFNRSAGLIIQSVLDAGFEISGLLLHFLKKKDATDYMDMYSDVPDFKEVINHLISGPSISLEI